MEVLPWHRADIPPTTEDEEMGVGLRGDTWLSRWPGSTSSSASGTPAAAPLVRWPEDTPTRALSCGHRGVPAPGLVLRASDNAVCSLMTHLVSANSSRGKSRSHFKLNKNGWLSHTVGAGAAVLEETVSFGSRTRVLEGRQTVGNRTGRMGSDPHRPGRTP